MKKTPPAHPTPASNEFRKQPGAAKRLHSQGVSVIESVLSPSGEPVLGLYLHTVHILLINSVTRDPRFRPIEVEDLTSLKVEISVLTPDVRIQSPEEIQIGRHGLDVRRGFARGLLLPQVAVEHGLDREHFLAATCRKAGLPADAWQDEKTEVRVFEAEVFGEE